MNSQALTRFWIEFRLSLSDKPPPGLLIGCGVTATSVDEALEIVSMAFFPEAGLPEVVRVEADVDISQLDPNHVLPNLGLTTKRGVWFPRTD